MSTDLSNGVIIPEEYSDDWYDEMSINLRKLNDVITAASDNATDIQRLDTDKANQSDLTALTSRVSQNETDIIALQTAVSGALKREIVQTLPTEDISTTTIYMIRNSQSSGTNIYDEYMYINSQWELIGTSATDFSNYYTKNETDNLLSGKVDNSTLGSYYTKTESDNLLSAKANQTDLTALGGRVTQTETDITALQTAVSGALKREIVQTLPTEDISTTTIYMIRNSQSSGTNIYDEYMYINSQWELIGTSATDFSNYYTKTEIDTLLSSKANDSGVMHLSGNETVSGTKNFSGILRIYNPDSSLNTAELWLKNSKVNRGKAVYGDQVFWFRDATDKRVTAIISRITPNGASALLLYAFNEDQDNQQVSNFLSFIKYLDGSCYLLPDQNDAIEMGSSTAKFKSINTNLINGLTPSSLSMPVIDRTKYVDISGYFTNTGNGDINTYSVTANGWIYLRLTNIDGCQLSILDSSNNRLYGSTSSGNLEQLCLPVTAGTVVETQWTTSTSVTVAIARFIPCQGNI